MTLKENKFLDIKIFFYYIFLILITPSLADENASNIFNEDLDAGETEEELQTEYPISEMEYKLLEQILESIENDDNNNNNNESEANIGCRKKRSIADYTQFWNKLKTLGIGVSGDIGIGLRLGTGDNEIFGTKLITHTNNVYDRYIGTNFHTIINGHLGHNSQEKESNANSLIYNRPTTGPTSGQSTTTRRNQASTNTTTGGRLISIDVSTSHPDVELFERNRLNEKLTNEKPIKLLENNDTITTENTNDIYRTTANTNVETKEILKEQNLTPTKITTSNKNQKKKTNYPGVFQKLFKYFNKTSDKSNFRFLKQNETLTNVVEKFFSKYLSRNSKDIWEDQGIQNPPLMLGTKDRLIPRVHRHPRSIVTDESMIEQNDKSELQSRKNNDDASVNFRNYILNMAGQYLLSLPDENNATNSLNTEQVHMNEASLQSRDNVGQANTTISRIRYYLLNTPVADMMKHALEEFQKISIYPEKEDDSIWRRIVNYVYNNNNNRRNEINNKDTYVN